MFINHKLYFIVIALEACEKQNFDWQKWDYRLLYVGQVFICEPWDKSTSKCWLCTIGEQIERITQAVFSCRPNFIDMFEKYEIVECIKIK